MTFPAIGEPVMKFLCWLFLAFLASNQLADAQLKTAKFKPYIFFRYAADSPEDHNYGAFHYTNIHNTLLPESVGAYYQSGLFHTWYRPVDIYGLSDYSRDKYGYHCMEGGAGYKPYLRFRSRETPQKFTTGAVAGGFGSFSNGPGQGVPSFKRTQGSRTLGWEKNLGRYGAAQLSNRLLYPLDGVGFEEGTNNKMLGYGYYTLPLTEPKDSFANTDAPVGNRCWTLFFNTTNFKGPVCFFTPYHWAKRSIDHENVRGMCFDDSLLKVNSTYQRETNVIPGKQWEAPNGDVYYRITPYTLPVDDDNIGRFGSAPMTIDSTMWDRVAAWFNGGEPAAPTFGKVGKAIHVRKSTGGRLAYTFDKKVRVNASSFSKSVKDQDPSAAAFSWDPKLMKRLDGKDLIQIPEYYVLRQGKKTADPIPASEVPRASKLRDVRFPEDARDDFKFDGFLDAPITTPLNPAYKHQDEIVAVWKKPGPVAGPFVTQLSDGSQATYYWYKFNEQPAMLNSYMDDAERSLVQKRVEMIHSEWSITDNFVPDPKQELAALDQGLIVTPPRGLEVGYVPICVHQQKADQQPAVFPNIDRIKPGR